MTRAEQHHRDREAALAAGIVGVGDGAVRLSRYGWLPPGPVDPRSFPPYLVLKLAPFAKGWDGSWIAWIEDEAGLIVYSPRDEEFAEPFARTFRDAIFWLIADELRDCWWEPQERGMTVWRLEQWLPRLTGFLSEGQMNFLWACTKVTPTRLRSGNYAFVSEGEFESVTRGLLPQNPGRIRQYAELPN